MYAVIEVDGKQLRVQVGDVIRVESVRAAAGTPVVFDRVLAAGEGDSLRIGSPTVKGAQVRGTVEKHGRSKKVLIYLFKKRKNSNRKRGGHRQDHATVRIEAIEP